MDAPPIQYARTEDGVNLAYWTLGERKNPALIIVPHGIGHLTEEWEIEPYRTWYARLARRFFLVAYDARGSGLSQRGVTDLALARYAGDIAAVSTQVDLHRYALLAPGDGVPSAIRHAIDRPQAVSHLILSNPVVRGSESDATPWGRGIGRTAKVDWASFLHAAGALLTGYSRADLAEQIANMLDKGTTPEHYAAYRISVSAWDVTTVLAKVEAKTLVVGRKSSPVRPFASAQAVASSIPNARLIVARDSAMLMQLGNAEAYAQEIEAFVGAANSRPTSERAETDRPAPQNVDGLTPRELEVLSLVADGRRNAAIAEALTLAPATVTRHISNMLNKTELSNRTELARYATDHGLAGEA